MVGKLIKHELYRIFRIAFIPAIAMLACAILLRISLFGKNAGLPIVFLIFYIVAVSATIVICAWLGILRFYRTLFTGEGYMTLSLPVTADQLIISKLLSSIIALLCGGIVCALSIGILFIGQYSLDVELVITEVATIFNEILQIYASADWGVIAEEIILYVLVIPESFLLFYLVLSLAQLSSRNRVLIAVGIYIGGSFVVSILNTLFVQNLLESALEVSIHLYYAIQIIFTLAVDIGCYFIVRYIIKNKINLVPENV